MIELRRKAAREGEGWGLIDCMRGGLVWGKYCFAALFPCIYRWRQDWSEFLFLSCFYYYYFLTSS